MKQLKFFTLCCIAILFWGCSDLESLTEAKEGSDIVKDAPVLSEDEVLARANSYMRQLTGETRSGLADARVETVILNGGVSGTRSETSTEHPCYLVNYGEDEGFVLLDGDPSCFLLAISDESNLSMSDTIANKGLAMVLSGYGTNTDFTGPGFSGPETPNIELDCPPILPKEVRKWGQEIPFNAAMPLIPGSSERYPVGSAPLAAAMMMAYFEYPAEYNGYKFDWASIRKGTANDQVAKLISFIGSKMGTDYSSYMPHTQFWNIHYGFEAMDYYFGDPLKSFIHLSDQKPVFIPLPSYSSQTNRSVTKPAYVIGAYGVYDNYWDREWEWIIDGRMTVHYDPEAFLGTPPDAQTLYHCVWGSYGKANGYFRIASDGIGGNRYKPGEGDGVFDGHTDSSVTQLFNLFADFKQDIKPNSYL